jgi:hypothetical protein
MGLDLIYKFGDASLVTRFSMADWQTIEELKSHLPDAIAAMADVPELGEETTIPLNALRDAVERVDALLRDQPELLPYTYQFKCENFVIRGQRIKFDYSTRGMSGLQLPGDEESYYAIHAGLGECRLKKMTLRPDGTVQVVEHHQDLRNEQELYTSNVGMIKIRKRRAKTSLRGGLSSIRGFLANLPECSVITKIVC